MKTRIGWATQPSNFNYAMGIAVYDNSATSKASGRSMSDVRVCGTHIRQSFDFYNDNYVLNIEKSAFQPGEPGRGALAVTEAYSRTVNAFKDFVLKMQREKNLSGKRQGRSWSEETLQQVAADIKAWADVSKFITVKLMASNESPNTGSPIIGSIKVVIGGALSVKRHLPLEIEYGLELTENAGRKIELGNYAVESKWNKESTLELFIQLAAEAFQRMKDPGHVKDVPLFYLAADPVTAQIYETYGFSKMKDVVDHEGQPWQVMQASAESLFEHVREQLHVSKRIKLRQSEDRLRGLEDILPLNLDDSSFRIWSFPKIRYDHSFKASRRMTLLTSEVLPRIRPGSKTAFPVSNEPVRQVRIFDSKDAQININIFIPAKFFPLAENFDLMLHPQTRVRYFKGVLLIEQMTGAEGAIFQTTEVTIDPGLDRPTRIRHRSEESPRFDQADIIADYE